MESDVIQPWWASRRTWFCASVMFALALRAWVVWTLKWDSLNGDEAVAGLMAKHIAEGKHFPVFFYGQAHFGALEAYLNAVLFCLFGFVPHLIFALPMLFSVLLVWIEYQFAKTLFGSNVALSSAFVMALAPSAFLQRALSPGGGFALALLLQLAAIWLFLSFYRADSPSMKDFLGFCAISGLALWIWQIYIPIFVVLVGLWMAKRPRIEIQLAFLGVLLLIVASSPLWLYNLTHGGATFVHGFHKSAAVDTQSGLFSFLEAFVNQRVWNRRYYLHTWLAGLGGGDLVMVVITAIGIPLALRNAQFGVRRWRLSLSPVPLILLIAIVAFLVGNRRPQHLYILPLLLVPVALAGWNRRLSRFSMTMLVIALGVTNMATVWKAATGSPSRSDWHTFVEALRSHNLKYGYSSYWYAYPITFLSAEEIIITPLVTTPQGYRTDRYPAYTQMVNEAPQAFVLVPDRSPDRARIEELVGQELTPLSFQYFSRGRATLYWPLTRHHPLRKWLVSRG